MLCLTVSLETGEKTKQNDTQRANQSENIRRLEKHTGTPVRHQQITDTSKTTKPDTAK